MGFSDDWDIWPNVIEQQGDLNGIDEFIEQLHKQCKDDDTLMFFIDGEPCTDLERVAAAIREGREVLSRSTGRYYKSEEQDNDD